MLDVLTAHECEMVINKNTKQGYIDYLQTYECENDDRQKHEIGIYMWHLDFLKPYKCEMGKNKKHEIGVYIWHPVFLICR